MMDDLARDKCHEKIESDKQPRVADAVQVVRCRDCKSWVHGLCMILGADTQEDGYCYWGEKRDGGAEE
jgi:hypothetical protein